MSLEAIKLRFDTPLHLGRGLEDLDRSETMYHSDSLKSALFAVGLSQHDDWLANPEVFFDGFRLSSCFPFSAEELFLPKPFLNVRFRFSGTAEDRQAKKSKKVAFLAIKHFTRLLDAADGDEIELSESTLTPDGQFVCEHESIARRSFFKTEVQQRVAVPLEGEGHDTRPFYVDRLYFEQDCGLYFLVDFGGNARLRKQVLQTLRLLGDSGIGTDRTVGNGLFTFNEKTDVQPVALLVSGWRGQQLALGLYLPEATEYGGIDLDHSRWNLLKRGGYMGGSSNESFLSLRKKSLYFFSEGSVFSSATPLTGKTEDIRPEWNAPMHAVWRDGQCLFLNI